MTHSPRASRSAIYGRRDRNFGGGCEVTSHWRHAGLVDQIGQSNGQRSNEIGRSQREMTAGASGRAQPSMVFEAFAMTSVTSL